MTENNILRTALIQQHNTADTADNRRRLAEKVREAARSGARLVVLQELHDTLYFCQQEITDLCDLAVDIPSETTDSYAALACECGVVLVTSVFERRAPGLYHNTALVFDADGSLAGKYRKMHIPDDPGFYEKFYFTPGDLGFEPVDTSVGKLGVLVCWDQWFPEAAREMALRGAQMLIYPTAIGWCPGDSADEKACQREAWVTVQRGHAVANGLPVVAVNRVGFEADPYDAANGLEFWGTSFVAGPQGELLAMAPTDAEAVLTVDVDLKRSEWVRRWWPFLRDRRIDAYTAIGKRFAD